MAVYNSDVVRGNRRSKTLHCSFRAPIAGLSGDPEQRPRPRRFRSPGFRAGAVPAARGRHLSRRQFARRVAGGRPGSARGDGGAAVGRRPHRQLEQAWVDRLADAHCSEARTACRGDAERASDRGFDQRLAVQAACLSRPGASGAEGDPHPAGEFPDGHLRRSRARPSVASRSMAAASRTRASSSTARSCARPVPAPRACPRAGTSSR